MHSVGQLSDSPRLVFFSFHLKGHGIISKVFSKGCHHLHQHCSFGMKEMYRSERPTTSKRTRSENGMEMESNKTERKGARRKSWRPLCKCRYFTERSTCAFWKRRASATALHMLLVCNLMLGHHGFHISPLRVPGGWCAPGAWEPHSHPDTPTLMRAHIRRGLRSALCAARKGDGKKPKAPKSEGGRQGSSGLPPHASPASPAGKGGASPTSSSSSSSSSEAQPGPRIRSDIGMSMKSQVLSLLALLVQNYKH